MLAPALVWPNGLDPGEGALVAGAAKGLALPPGGAVGVNKLCPREDCPNADLLKAGVGMLCMVVANGDAAGPDV